VRDAVRKDELCGYLASIVGEANLLVAQNAVAEYARDFLRPYRGYQQLPRVAKRPLAVARPDSAEQLAAIMKLANQARVAVIPYGGGSGLMGGAVGLEPGIVIDLKAMNRILHISAGDKLARVEAGVILKTLEAALNKQGFILGHDPWSLPLATVGGAIATDGVGYRAAKYGSMGEQVMGLKVVLPEGDILETRAIPKSSTGLDIKQLFIGTEGCLGIVTEATIRIFPMPEVRLLRAYAFPDFEAGFEAVAEISALGLKPALLDYGESRHFPGVGRLLKKYYQKQGPTLYLGFEGLRETAVAEMERADSICRTHGSEDLGVAEVEKFWEERHWTAEQYARLARRREWDRLMGLAGNIKMDFVHVALPKSQVIEYHRQSQQILSRHGIRALDWGTWTCPELFSIVMVKVALTAKQARQEMSQAVDELLALAHDMGGSMEYCHGVGIRLSHLMRREHGTGLDVLQRVKESLDPHNILNPGKLSLGKRKPRTPT